MSFSIRAANIEEKPVIYALLQAYLDELSGFPGEVIDYKDANGIYRYPYLDNYWLEDTRVPYLLFNDNALAGFALVRKEADHWEMAEFYVKPLFRRTGLAGKVVSDILKRHPGTWKINFNLNNEAAGSFWKKIAQIYTSGDIVDRKTESGHQFVQFTTQNRELFEYYNERAPEYEAFYRGEFPTGTPDHDLYKNDTGAISNLLPDFLNGNCIDIACGTGFWLPLYEKNCDRITLIDQSEEVLVECTKKIQKLGIEQKTEVIRDNIFNHSNEKGKFDSALVGFLISHFNDTELSEFFTFLKPLLKNNGNFVLIDSIWSEEVAAIRHTKVGIVNRPLFDGREFQIYKNCFEKNDLERLARDNDIDLDIIYWGKVFFLVSGKFR